MKGGSHRPTAHGWLNMSEDNGETAGEVGGIVVPFTAAASLLVGDVVFLSAASTVNKSATLADYTTAAVGVVVGGEGTHMAVMQDDALVGALVAAKVNERVLVAVQGIVKVVSGVALATIGTEVTASAVTAGRVTNVGVAAGNIFGKIVTAAAGAGSVIRLLLRPR